MAGGWWPVAGGGGDKRGKHSFQIVCTDTSTKIGGLAQLVERVLSMHEVSGSIPEFSTRLPFAAPHTSDADEVRLLLLYAHT